MATPVNTSTAYTAPPAAAVDIAYTAPPAAADIDTAPPAADINIPPPDDDDAGPTPIGAPLPSHLTKFFQDQGFHGLRKTAAGKHKVDQSIAGHKAKASKPTGYVDPKHIVQTPGGVVNPFRTQPLAPAGNGRCGISGTPLRAPFTELKENTVGTAAAAGVAAETAPSQCLNVHANAFLPGPRTTWLVEEPAWGIEDSGNI